MKKFRSESELNVTIYKVHRREIVDDLMAASEWLCCRTGSPRAIGARSLISSRMVSRSLIFCGRMWILPWREAASKMRISRDAIRPTTHDTHAGESVRREGTSPLARSSLFLPHFSLTHRVFPALISGSEKLHFNNQMESKWNEARLLEPFTCVYHVSRKAGLERWLPATNASMPMT